jgi:hypothetical protein
MRVGGLAKGRRRILLRRRQHGAAGAVAAVLLAGILLGGLRIAGQAAASDGPAGLDARTQGAAIMAHLNAVIQFYREVHVPVQKTGEPNDAVYQDEAAALATQVGMLAFQSAQAEAALLEGSAGQAAAATGSSQQQRLAATQATVEKRIVDLEAREAALDRQMASASGRTLEALTAQRKQVAAALDLSNAMKGALGRILAASSTAASAGLPAQITRLEGSAPELQSKNKTSGAPLTTVGSTLSAGITTQGEALIEMTGTLHALGTLSQANERLRAEATALRAPMMQIVRGLLQRGDALSQEAATAPAAETARGRAAAHASAAAGASGPAPEDLQTITAQFKATSAATIPLSEELIALEQSSANLAAWQASVEQEYETILHALVLRLLVIALALALIVGGGEAWTRATTKYIRDLRRRRQLLIVRRVVVGFLSAVVLLFGFVTQFSSLATFAGFITAGIAVGLQTVLLSVAAYFFIVGRFGIKVGDRITIAGVTGDVIEVGLVRFYLMELAGSGMTLNPTGRVAVFSNAVLFQAGTPLYKQLPGTGYAWHELTVKLADGADYAKICDAILAPVHAAYEEYRPSVERQHESVQNWMQATIETPGIESRLQFSGGSFQLWARFPVEIGQAAETDEKITHALLDLLAKDAEMKAAVTGIPSIQASVRG